MILENKIAKIQGYQVELKLSHGHVSKTIGGREFYGSIESMLRVGGLENENGKYHHMSGQCIKEIIAWAQEHGY
jgi:hypothetical protein